MELPSQIYFDNAATTLLLPEALDCLTETSRYIYGNSSSAHAVGKKSSEILNQSKNTFAAIFNVPPDHVVFTSGGTESNNLAIWGALGGIVNVFHWLRSPVCQEEQVLTSAVEHPATQKIFEQFDLLGANVGWLGVDSECFIDKSSYEESLENRKRIRLLSVHHAHNEIGTVQPIASISQRLREHSPEALVHIDAIQSFTKVPIDMKSMGVDMVSLSAHKIGGPKGIGALILGQRFADRKPKLGTVLAGSGQQEGLRPGTVPVPLIASFAVAAKHGVDHLQAHREKLISLRNSLVEQLPASVVINGPADMAPSSEARAPQTLNFSVPGLNSGSIVEILSAKGICVSAGAACKSGKSAGSEVILRMGLGAKRAQNSIRVSFSMQNTQKEVSRFADAIRELSP